MAVSVILCMYTYTHFWCVDTIYSVHMCEYSNLVEGWETAE